MEINYLLSKTTKKSKETFWIFRYRERMISLVDRLKYLVSRQEEAKKSIKEKVNNIKSAHKEIMELEPNLRNSFTRMRKIEIVVFELEDRINRKEDEIRCKKKIFLAKTCSNLTKKFPEKCQWKFFWYHFCQIQTSFYFFKSSKIVKYETLFWISKSIEKRFLYIMFLMTLPTFLFFNPILHRLSKVSWMYNCTNCN